MKHRNKRLSEKVRGEEDLCDEEAGKNRISGKRERVREVDFLSKRGGLGVGSRVVDGGFIGG